MKIANINNSFWVFGLTIGFVTAFVITLVITIWEWLENPGGIFHNGKGTNWSFVFDTAISWFVPTFIQVTIVSALVHIILTIIKRFRNSR